MAHRRARSADRGGERLADALERIAARPAGPGQLFKAPQYDGKGDVEYFILRFEEVVEANDWEDAATLLHLREALKEGAQDCGRGATVPAIFATLRARYGLSPRAARTRLSTYRKEHGTSLQEHATDIERLVRLAYGDVPENSLIGIVIETFCSTLGNAYLQRHLLAVPTPTLEAAVRAGNEYLQIQPSSRKGPHPPVNQVEEEEDNTVNAVNSAHSAANPESLLTSLMQSMKQLADQMGQMQTEVGAARRNPGPKRKGCWGCHKEGHLRKDCPTHPWPATEEPSRSGNGPSPQQ